MKPRKRQKYNFTAKWRGCGPRDSTMCNETYKLHNSVNFFARDYTLRQLAINGINRREVEEAGAYNNDYFNSLQIQSRRKRTYIINFPRNRVFVQFNT